jgi:hypothetical protein
MHELCVSGHSFGAITATQLVKKNIPNLKAAICLDTWYLPVCREVEDGKYSLDKKSCPVLSVVSERFPGEMADSSACKGVYDQKFCADSFVRQSDGANAKLE